MMQLINYDAVEYILLKTMKDLRKAGRNDLALRVEGIARDLQDHLDELMVTACPECGARFDSRWRMHIGVGYDDEDA